jgi:hypothetical protein
MGVTPGQGVCCLWQLWWPSLLPSSYFQQHPNCPLTPSGALSFHLCPSCHCAAAGTQGTRSSDAYIHASTVGILHCWHWNYQHGSLQFRLLWRAPSDTPSPRPPLVAIFHPDSVSGCSKTPWTLNIHWFKAPRVSQFRSIDPFSRCYLSIALQDKVSNRMLFFLKSSLPNQSITASQISTLRLRLVECLIYSAARIGCMSSDPPILSCNGLPSSSLEAGNRSEIPHCFFLLTQFLWFSAFLLPALWLLMVFLSFSLQNLVSLTLLDSSHSYTQNSWCF